MVLEEQSNGGGFLTRNAARAQTDSYLDYSCYIVEIAYIATAQSDILVHDLPDRKPSGTRNCNGVA